MTNITVTLNIPSPSIKCIGKIFSTAVLVYISCWLVYYYAVYSSSHTYKNLELRTLVNDENERKSQLRCKKILQGDRAEILKAKKVPYPGYNDDFMAKVAKNCDAFRSLRGYHTNDDISEDERSFPLAFAIVGHNQPDAFERLLRLIYRPHNFYCVHVDLAARDSIFQAFASIVKCFPNVRLVTKREVTIYWSFTLLRAHLNCFSDLLKHKWKYLINYASSELPLRPNNQIIEILRLYNNTNIIGTNKPPAKSIKIRWMQKHVTLVNEQTKTGKIKNLGEENDPPPFSLNMTKNMVSGAFTRDFVKYIFHDKRAKEFLNWTKSTAVPDEHFFGTLNNGVDNGHMEAPGANIGDRPYLKYNMRYARWANEPEKAPCQGYYRHGVCVFGVGDLPSLTKVRHLIANKFSMNKSIAAVDCLEYMVAERSRATSCRYLRRYEDMLCIE